MAPLGARAEAQDELSWRGNTPVCSLHELEGRNGIRPIRALGRNVGFGLDPQLELKESHGLGAHVEYERRRELSSSRSGRRGAGLASSEAEQESWISS